ncbi:hypothetical protein Tco_1092661 [Tanacetum coccineum]|uniref:Uncharacterized protein n=1 Tax=Tanacetum coccineum TaxID=301880 RepID=A0ABQ5IAH2_9ASTR
MEVAVAVVRWWLWCHSDGGGGVEAARVMMLSGSVVGCGVGWRGDGGDDVVMVEVAWSGQLRGDDVRVVYVGFGVDWDWREDWGWR